MNNFQKERREIFKEVKFNEARKQAVIDAVQAPPKSQKQWIPIVAFASILVFSSIFLFTPQDSLQTTEENTSTSLEQLIAQQFAEQPFEKLMTIKPFLTDKGALIVNKVQWEQNGEWQYYLQYAESEKNRWEMKMQFPYLSYENKWESIMVEDHYFMFGILSNKTVDSIIVGNQKADVYDLKNDTWFWIAEAKSQHSPVYFEVNGKKERQSLWETNVESSISFIEGNKNEQTLNYTRYTMNNGNDEYMKFPLLYDPYYYAENPYDIGDVVVIETDNGLEVTRIIDANQNQLVIDESTIILFEDVSRQEFFLQANYAGDTSIYSDERIVFPRAKADEVFVHPDNWASAGFRGPIAKTAIKGKVLGYDLLGVTNTMTESDFNRYDTIQQLVHTNSADALNKFLKDESPQQIANIYYYAGYIQDYKTMYALLSQSTKVKFTYEKWQLQMQRAFMSPSANRTMLLQHYLVNIYYAGLSKMNEKRSQLEWRDANSGELIFNLPMIQEDGVWKVVYNTVKNNSK